jgi:hypothetical protein
MGASAGVVLVAAAFPRIVMHTSVWLSEVGLDVSLVQVALWRSADDLVCSFERLYLLDDTLRDDEEGLSRHRG